MNVPGSLSSALQTMYFGFGRLLVDELPLEAGRETGAAAAAKARLLDVVDHGLGRHRQRLLQALVAGLVLQVVIERVAAGRERVLGEHRLVVRASPCTSPASSSCP